MEDYNTLVQNRFKHSQTYENPHCKGEQLLTDYKLRDPLEKYTNTQSIQYVTFGVNICFKSLFICVFVIQSVCMSICINLGQKILGETWFFQLL